MIKQGVIIAIALLLLASPLMAGATDKVSWKNGYTWTYNTAAGDQTTRMTFKVVDVERVPGDPGHWCWVVRSTFSIEGEEIAMTTYYDAENRRGGETSMGIYKQDIPLGQMLGMMTGELGGDQTAMPGMESIKASMVYAPKPGEQMLPIGDREYETEILTAIGLGPMEGMGGMEMSVNTGFVIQNMGRETIKVPAGTFDTYHVRITSETEATTMDFMGQSMPIPGQTTTKDVWFSYDVRNIVRMESASQGMEGLMGGMSGQQATTVMELASYSL